MENVPKVLKVPYENGVVDLEVSYFAALEPEQFVSNQAKGMVIESGHYNDYVNQLTK